ncbi:helix-turn-helix transcriptional regulator [Aminipila butyrica]|uniref:Helix-turn-helix transcriptional regulator n=1 Tax=Aminipila butyrica TaxID=433296 RepID=A0A858BPJ0_9FIRM|nr:helix-turn-helix transcriptional regulator [Aminipila butyrica]QIB67791.1 helix-turn-helix transcriptional regulator [Aminipila butyrica]
MSIVAINVYRIIEEKCLKQSAVALKAGYDPKKFNAMLRGRKTITSEDVLPIAGALEVEVNDLFTQNGQIKQ